MRVRTQHNTAGRSVSRHIHIHVSISYWHAKQRGASPPNGLTTAGSSLSDCHFFLENLKNRDRGSDCWTKKSRDVLGKELQVLCHLSMSTLRLLILLTLM